MNTNDCKCIKSQKGSLVVVKLRQCDCEWCGKSDNVKSWSAKRSPMWATGLMSWTASPNWKRWTRGWNRRTSGWTTATLATNNRARCEC